MKRKYTRKKTGEVVSKPIDGSLPPDILESIERTCKTRKALGLSDDSAERTERALRYQEFMQNRL
jgi:hypothetical protein